MPLLFLWQQLQKSEAWPQRRSWWCGAAPEIAPAFYQAPVLHNYFRLQHLGCFKSTWRGHICCCWTRGRLATHVGAQGLVGLCLKAKRAGEFPRRPPYRV
ncbi:hypothetical protein E2320_012266 [Naja naja]|nr:hypothetical protein E2320_012266 [Naja naja]